MASSTESTPRIPPLPMQSEDPSSSYRGRIPTGDVFDVDTRMGFMASKPSLARLPPQWETWESTLDLAINSKLQLGDKIGITQEEEEASERWRAKVREMPVLSVKGLDQSTAVLRRAHLVLTFLLHFYIQSLPPTAPVLIPRPISLPLLRVAKILNLPPLLTYSDTVLYNWDFKVPPSTSSSPSPAEDPVPSLDNLRSQTMFTNLVDEEEFYLCSARIEIRGVEALSLMRSTMDETFVGDSIAVKRITTYLDRLSQVISELKDLLLDVKRACRPDPYYNEVRPWFRGEDSDLNKRKWVFEGLDELKAEGIEEPKELSGPSAGQSSVVHVLDIFLGVDHQSQLKTDAPATSSLSSSSSSSTTKSHLPQKSFMARMQTYMPHKHRQFLNHLASSPRPLRDFVISSQDNELEEAYNKAVMALKEFRDAHMIIATLYIIGPARRAEKRAEELRKQKEREEEERRKAMGEEEKQPLKGTGGTDLVKFLKDTRNRTLDTVLR